MLACLHTTLIHRKLNFPKLSRIADGTQLLVNEVSNLKQEAKLPYCAGSPTVAPGQSGEQP